MNKNICERCEHMCHCNKNDEHRIITDCECIGCNCPKANVWNYEEDKVADKYEKEKRDRANDQSFENNGGVIIDDTNDCEGCQ